MSYLACLETIQRLYVEVSDPKNSERFAASDILSDITPEKSENSSEQTKTTETKGKQQIVDTVRLEPKNSRIC
jgi:hypothetical protein